jgi:hypothetical protein
MSRYVPSRYGLWAGWTLGLIAAAVGWVAWGQPLAMAGVVPLALVAAALCYLGMQPSVELRADHLLIGRHVFRWGDIRQVDRLSRGFPLVVRLRLTTGRAVRLLFPARQDVAASLLRNIRRMAKAAYIEGRPYREFWGETIPAIREPRQTGAHTFRLLLPEDEAEVERLYQRLRTAGRIDSKRSADET